MLRAVALGAGWCLLCVAVRLLFARRLEAEVVVPRLLVFTVVRAELFFPLVVLFFSFEEVLFFAVDAVLE
ncbi:hypothetical protein GCM10011585_25560 [Edaphobacter dinghuensis]|uniref:Uncharacterized protein n=1 Tax=Edaphobacter dinghuensis TaxID=1560005 RepID=A0A917M6S7_9BACT|nr:hypothetical protein GCM10011585_25560 [Edaphobacter dinghuensis]